ncbi:MAG: NADH-quinone oxidoreductase subunit A [Chloroflexi bacterium]|jgi:NADH-quinone oxidoreductase subunit A|nr:NADH-quinone oxidoreductase subunit A [Chloroflexota bacterium]MBT3669190.1 NADH-quinone oxidoreductase subunit A [Chloroflexota bacterium]MBT4002726.1 NADH-quinone oxidoreductase subunit A [Chloroflexota bacterium]MBT4306435.1 NADH-quinone oxidoreductase subunit A [Chloroflexota bacterium]MBT4534934.1 NADH-quinone oxidoreductase subunit A [Chloroflexota bacterium]
MLQDYLNDYWPIAILLLLTTLLGIVAIGLGYLFGPRRSNKRKNAPYESGMSPIGPGTRQLPVKFYIVAVLFILFDIEVVFLLPWAVIFKKFVDEGLGNFVLIEMIIFLGILLVGYVYAWKKGAFEWD